MPTYQKKIILIINNIKHCLTINELWNIYYHYFFISKLAHLVYFILKEYIPLFYIKVEEIFDH